MSSDSIGTRCLTGANVDAGRPPGRWVGESGVTSVGYSLLERAQLADERVELGVGHFGFVEHEVALVVVLDQLAELLRPLPGVGGRRRLLGLRGGGHVRNLPIRCDSRARRQAPIASFVAAA